MNVTDTSIEWCRSDDGSEGKTWNPTRGCSRISPGCGGAKGEGGCYAERIASRFSGPGLPFEGLVRIGKQGPRWTGKMRLAEDKLLEPIRWKKASRIFVNSMSDLFHENLADEEIDSVFSIMLACEILENAAPHTFQILTKRAERMRRYFETGPAILVKRWALAGDRHIHMKDECTVFSEYVRTHVSRVWTPGHGALADAPYKPWGYPEHVFPLRRVHLGVSVEDQKYAEERIPLLIQTPAAVRFISAEPLLGPIDISIWLYRGVIEAKLGDADFDALNWVIVGGESGPGARPFDLQWARRIVEDCKEAHVACFVKQLGANAISSSDDDRRHVGDMNLPRPYFRLKFADRKGGDIGDFPEDLQVREFPVAP